MTDLHGTPRPAPHHTTRPARGVNIHPLERGQFSAVVDRLGVVLMEFGDFAMFRRMLLGIKERAESADLTAR